MPHRLAITPGEPAGIGPDICIQAAQQQQVAELVVFADRNLIQDRARRIGLPIQLKEFDPASPVEPNEPGTLTIRHHSLNNAVEPGEVSAGNAIYILDTLRSAVTACQQQQVQALVTGPVNKGLINQAGFIFSGHTELLTELTNSPHTVMMLATESLRVALATTHLPLREVADHINSDSLCRTLKVIHDEMREKFTIEQPSIYVCGLNPHAGDSGALGEEEITVIEPVIKELNQQGLSITGPLSADTIFSPENIAQADVFLAMYHDQGLPVLKYSGFSQAINITLGLNIIRTSVDHGTAFDKAGTGTSSCQSLQLAIDTANQMCGK